MQKFGASAFYTVIEIYLGMLMCLKLQARTLQLNAYQFFHSEN